MKRIPHAICLAAALFAACEKTPVPGNRNVLAKIGAREILPADLAAEVERRSAAGQPVPAKAILLGEMVLEECSVQRALTLGLDKDPEVQRTWRSLLIGTLKNRELDAAVRGVSIESSEIEAHYQASQGAWMLPERGRLAVIFAALPPEHPRRTGCAHPRTHGGSARPCNQRFQTSRRAVFRASEHAVSRWGTWLDRARESACIFACEGRGGGLRAGPGAVSEVLEDQGGLYIVKLVEHAEAARMPLAQVEQKIRATLTRDRRAMLAAGV